MSLFNCKLCINYDICEEPCPAIEEALREQKIYSKDYIRKRSDYPFSPDKLDNIASGKAFKMKFGRKIPQNIDFSA